MTKPRPSETVNIARTISAASSAALFLPGILVRPERLAGQPIRVAAAGTDVMNSFRPPDALGSRVDRVLQSSSAPFFNLEAVKQILSAGWGTISDHEETELSIEASHSNAKGTANDPAGKSYLTGDDNPTEMFRPFNAYDLPHRGFVCNQGSEDDGYSQLNGGETNTRGSHPYLTKAFTREDDALHPQWVMVDLGARVDVNAIRIDWANPYARRYAVQFWTGTLEPFYDGTMNGTWQTFPQGYVTAGKGGIETLKLMAGTVAARYLRIWMTESSNTCDTHGAADKRNCVGYAINELYIGTLSANGFFNDVVQHLPSRRQTVTKTHPPFYRHGGPHYLWRRRIPMAVRRYHEPCCSRWAGDKIYSARRCGRALSIAESVNCGAAKPYCRIGRLFRPSVCC